ncbi:MAG: sugar ABC transporter permease [Lachnospiraceae bacterium]|jgi:multiple sugar transport system permease protein|nr:sugar ABC transporter permease [Lachnospiraceae bacterium]
MKNKKTTPKKPMSDKQFGWLLIAPLCFVLAVFMLYPTVYAVVMSFTKYLMKGTPTWIGADNYRYILHNSEMWNSLGRTGLTVIICIVFELVLGMLLALLLNRDFRGQGIVRGLCFMPLLISPLAMSLIWSYILNNQYGIVNIILGWFNIYNIPWFSSVSMAKYTIMGMTIWQWLPFSTFVLLAGLKGLPKDQFEAAQVDGSSSWNTFWRLTVPTLKPLIMIIVLLRVMSLIRTYDPLYGTTRGGLGTETFDWYVYRMGFVKYDVGRGTALGVFSLVITLLISNVLYSQLMKALKKR